MIFAVGLHGVCCVNEEQVVGWLYLYPASHQLHQRPDNKSDDKNNKKNKLDILLLPSSYGLFSLLEIIKLNFSTFLKMFFFLPAWSVCD